MIIEWSYRLTYINVRLLVQFVEQCRGGGGRRRMSNMVRSSVDEAIVRLSSAAPQPLCAVNPSCFTGSASIVGERGAIHSCDERCRSISFVKRSAPSLAG